MIVVYTALLALVAIVCAVGGFASQRVRSRWISGGVCAVALVALGGAYQTGFTFRLNRAATVATDRLVYLVPNCLCNPDSNNETDPLAVHVRNGQIAWRHPIRTSGLGPNNTFTSDDQRVYLQQYAPDASHLNESVLTALDAQTGQQLWQVTNTTTGSWVGAFSGRLVLSNLQSTWALDATTGQHSGAGSRWRCAV
jgi:hypothetical protein